MADNLDNKEGLVFDASAQGVDKVVEHIRNIDKALLNVEKTISNLNAKLDSNKFMQLNAEMQRLSKTIGLITKQELIKNEELIKLQETVRLDEKRAKVDAIRTSLISKNTQLETANLELKTAQNNALAKSQTYLKSQVDYKKSIKNKQDAINKALKDAELLEDNNVKKTKTQSKFIGEISKSLLKFLSLRQAGRFIGKIVSQAGSWIENINLFSVTFNDQAQEMLDWALEFSNKLGVSNNEIIKMAGLFKQVSTSIGVADDMSDTLSKTLTKLTYDLASYYNIADINTVSEKLQSGIFSGQIRSLRSFGFDVSQESIQTLIETNDALSKIGISASNLTQAQKAIARTIITLRDGSNAFGDMSKTIDTLANRVRVLQGSWENLQLAFGRVFQDVASKVIAYITGIVQALTTIIEGLFGKAKGIEKETENALGDVNEELEETEQTANNFSFDKFEVFTTGDDENKKATEELNKLLEEQIKKYEEIESQFDGIDEKVNSVKNAILDWVFPNRTAEELGQLNPLLNTLKETFESLWSVIKKVGEALVEIGPPILDIINKVVTWLDKNNLLLPTIEAIVFIVAGVKLINGITKVTECVKSLNGALGALAIGLAVFEFVYKISQTFDGVAKFIWGLVVAVTALAIALVAATNPATSLIKVPLVAAAIGASIAGISLMMSSAMEGFAEGGIPKKSELFYMNENGVPEALINTGGSQTNVVNMQQLRQMTKEGFIEAINETGLSNGFVMTLEGRNIDNSSVARGLFPALKIESKRQGGNQL